MFLFMLPMFLYVTTNNWKEFFFISSQWYLKSQMIWIAKRCLPCLFLRFAVQLVSWIFFKLQGKHNICTLSANITCVNNCCQTGQKSLSFFMFLKVVRMHYIFSDNIQQLNTSIYHTLSSELCIILFLSHIQECVTLVYNCKHFTSVIC